MIGTFVSAITPDLRVIVVDNASGDGSPDLAETAGARVLRNGRNLGFGAACNLGAAAAGTEFVLYANPDVSLSVGAVTELIAAADAFPDAAILVPIIHLEGRPDRSWDVAQFRRPHLPAERDAEPLPRGPICVEFASGACLLVRSDAGLRFDEGFFLYYEDDDICMEARRRGRSVVLVPTAVVSHVGAASTTPSMGLVWLKSWHMAWSRLRFTHKHAGTATAGREAWRQLRRYGVEAVRHATAMKRSAALGSVAELAGTLAWLCGRRGPAFPTPWKP